MISSYGGQIKHRIILHIIIVATNAASNCSECFQRHLMFYTCNYNIRVTHRNGAIKHILHSESTEGSSTRLFFIHFVAHALALHLAVKMCFKSFYERFEHVNLTYICQLYFPPECQQDRTLLRNNTIK